MGLGYLEHLVLWVAIGADMLDCVYLARGARFRTALVASGLPEIPNTRVWRPAIDRYRKDVSAIQVGSTTGATYTLRRRGLSDQKF